MQTALRADFFDEVNIGNRKLRALFDARVKEKGLTLPRVRALLTLARHSDSGQMATINQRTLAEEMELETPTVVRLLDGMERQGFIERRTEPNDRRAKQVVLTDLGHRLAAEIRTLVDDLRSQLLSDIDEADIAVALKVFRTMSVKIQSLSAR